METTNIQQSTKMQEGQATMEQQQPSSLSSLSASSSSSSEPTKTSTEPTKTSTKTELAEGSRTKESSPPVSINDLVKNKEIHDVLHKFHLTARKHEDLCTVASVDFTHGLGKIDIGQTVDKTSVPNAPHVTWDAKGHAENEMFAVLIVDPDANGEYLHYAVFNAKPHNGKGDNRNGHTSIHYAPPTPPSGTHRYFTLVLRQECHIPDTLMIPHRHNFDIGKFCNEHKMHLYALHYFKASA